MPPSRSTFGPLRHPHFKRVWIGAAVSSVGGWMEMTGVQWAMAKATLDTEWIAHNPALTAPLMMAYLAAAQLFPQLFLGILGGVAADRLNRKTLLLVTQSARMVIAAALTLAALRGVISPWALIVLGGLDGIAMAFNIPAWQVLTPRLVPREELADAITLNGLQFNVARAVGPALAGLLMGVAEGVWALFALNTLSYAVILFAVALTPDAPAPASRDAHPWRQVGEAWSYVRGHIGPWRLIIGIAVFSMLATPFLRFLPILIQEIYLPTSTKDRQETAFGLLLGAMGVGAVAGALTVRRIPAWYPKHHFIPLSILLCALTLVVIAFATSIWVAAVAIAVCGIFWMWAFNAAWGALQMLLPDALRGRVSAIANTISFGAMPVGAYIAGVVGQAVAGRESEGLAAMAGTAAASIALVAVAAAMLTWRTPEIDGLRPGDAGYDRVPGLVRGITGRAHRPPAAG